VVLSATGRLPAESPVWDGPATVVTSPAGAEALQVPSGVEVVIDEDATADGVSLPAAVEVARTRATQAAPAAGRELPAEADGADGPGASRPDGADAFGEARSSAPPFVLAEPGPGLFAALLRGGLVDELFLTLSPLLAGPASGRLELMGGPGYASLSLLGLNRAGSHLFSRWRPARTGERPEDVIDP
jgi:riboflavin biosynthesis pyrimidine reductase